MVQWFKNEHGWCKGSIISITGSSKDSKTYSVRYDDDDDDDDATQEKVFPYSASAMPKLIKTAAVEPGTRLEVFWPHEKAWFPATVEQERTHKRENYLVCYDGKTDREWIDLHRHKIRILKQQSHHHLYHKKLPAKAHPREVVVRKSSSLSNGSSSPSRKNAAANLERQPSVNSQASSASMKPPPPQAAAVVAGFRSKSADASPAKQQTKATARIPKNDSNEDDRNENDRHDSRNAEKPAALVVPEASISDGISPASSSSNRSVVRGLDHGTVPSPSLQNPAAGAEGTGTQEPSARVVSTSSQPAAMALVSIDDPPPPPHVASREDAPKPAAAAAAAATADPPAAATADPAAVTADPAAATADPAPSNATKRDSEEQTLNVEQPDANDEPQEGIILDPVNDPATMSAVYSLIGVGSRVSIYWEEDGAFFNATVTDRKMRGKPFYVEYDDGDEEWIDLRLHRIRLIPPSDTSENGDRFVGGKRLRRVSAKEPEPDPVSSSAAADTAAAKSNPLSKPLKRVSKKSVTLKRKQRHVAAPAALKRLEAAAADEDEEKDGAYSDSSNDTVSLASDDDSDAPTGASAGGGTLVGKRKAEKSGKSVAPSGMKAKSDDLSKIAVGSRVAVWWDGDEQYYNGTIKKERSHRKQFLVEYDDDGKCEWLDFAEHDFKLLPSLPAERKRRGRPSHREDPSKVRVGSRVAVWWASVSKFLEGTVTKKRKQDHPYFIEYDEDETGHWIDFSKHTFRLLDVDGNSPKLKSGSTPKPKSVPTPAKSTTKKTESTSADDGNGEKTRKRKRPPEYGRKESTGDALAGLEITVGTRVAVYWEGDSKYYEGEVTKERKTGKKRHYLVYDDGEAAHWIDFKEHWVRVLPDRPPKKQKSSKTEDASSKTKRKLHESADDGPAKKLSRRARAAERARLLAKIKIGVRVEIWWAGDECYYGGKVVRQGEEKNRFYVKYDDGEEEWVNFSRQAFRLLTNGAGALIEGGSSEEEEFSDDPQISHSKPSKEYVDFSDLDEDETHKYSDFVFGKVDSVRVGSKLSVWWPGEKRYFEGKVAKIDNSRKPYFIKYNDGDEEWTDLRRRYFRIL